MSESKLLTTAQAADRLGVCSRTVINLIEKGYLEYIRPAWAYFVTDEALEDYKRRKAEGKVPSVGRPKKIKSEIVSAEKGGERNVRSSSCSIRAGCL